MAHKSMEHGALNITLTYLKQADRLSKILAEYGDEEESSTYLAQIAPLMTQTLKYMRYSSVTGPPLPSRRGSTEQSGYQRKRSLGELVTDRRRSEDSDDTLRATKVRPVVRAQIHAYQDEYGMKRREPNLAPNDRKDNVRIRA